MTYQETIDYLYNATPQFQLIGAAAYKPGLDTAHRLDDAFGNPHKNYRTIHVAGTNGKGSTCHTLASILQAEDYKVGLYTSPHLIDFRERIKVNGEKIPCQAVIDFIERYKDLGLDIRPSFFELTTIMAFDWFRQASVDFALIETGLGGRLDTTNIISPILSVITNISYDHTAQLGNTLEKIAAEKAGIIKPFTPVIIGNQGSESVRAVFEAAAKKNNAPIIFAQENNSFSSSRKEGGYMLYCGTLAGDILGELTGDCQIENTMTILTAIKELCGLGVSVSKESVRQGFKSVVASTGLMGRWMKLAEHPMTICDTGHNEGGWQYLSQTLRAFNKPTRMIIGFVSDKDVDKILRIMPKNAIYYFTRASIPRAMDQTTLAGKAKEAGLKGESYPTVEAAYKAAKDEAAPEDIIFIGGSTFVVADMLKGYFNVQQ